MRRATLLAFVCLASLSLISWISCGGGSSSGSPNANSNSGTSGGGSGSAQQHAFLYISESTNKITGLIEAFKLNTTSGALSPVPGSPFSTGTSTAGDLALSPSNSVAYMLAQNYPPGTCCIGTSALQVYALDSTVGVPSLQQTLAAGDGSQSIAVHPSGKFVYIAPWNRDNTGIGIYTVASDGTVTPANIASANAQDSAVVTPDGKYLYTHTDGAPVGNWLDTDPCGPIVTNLWAYSIDTTSGALAPVAGDPFTFQRRICTVGHESDAILKRIDPAGKNLYLVDEANRNLLVFSIDDSTGALAEQGSPIHSDFSSIAMDPAGRFLYVGGILEFSGYQISSGTPALIPGMPKTINPVPADNETGSTNMAIDSSGNYLFSNQNGYTSAFSCCDPDGFVAFKIDQNSGALTQISVSPSTLKGTASGMASTH